MLIQLYNGAKDNTGSEIEITAALRTILDGTHLKQKTDSLRIALKELQHMYSQLQATNDDAWKRLIDKQEKYCDKLKQNLPAVTWSGTFTKRNKDLQFVKQHSQLICIDLDYVNPHFNFRKKLEQDTHTHICFTSPGGHGIKVVFKIAGTADHHKGCFLSIEKYFLKLYNIAIDKSGKDISRLCFLCHDADIFINENSMVYVDYEPQQLTEKPKAFTKKEVAEFETTEDFYSILSFTDQRITYSSGSRNNYIYLFANNCNRKGFNEQDTLFFCLNYFIDGINANEVTASVKSAFTHNKHEHAKYAKKVKPVNSNTIAKAKNDDSKIQHQGPDGNRISNSMGAAATAPATKNNGVLPQSNGSSAKQVVFWKERKITKGKDENKFTVSQYELKRVPFVDFLYQQGFHLIDTDAKGYQICHSSHGIIEPVDPRIIKKHVFAWCKKNVHEDIEEMLRKGQKQFFAGNEMDSLHTRHIELKTDTETESFFYFKNCWVTVTADNITTHNYTELKQYIWAGNKKEHEFTVQQPKLFTEDTEPVLTPAAMDCEFAKFVYLVAYNPNNEDEKDFTQELIMQRFTCFCTAIGFLLDGYKHPANRKAIFALDHKIGERNESHGRTGKSIITKACEKLKVVSHINGKSYDIKYQFRNEPITADAQIIDFNDMKRNFDIEEIFEFIADDYSVNRRNNGFLHFKYETSPKVYYSTNSIPRGEGASYTGRMHIIEFSDYFTPTHTPFNEFNHGLLGTAWDQDEWNRFYNFMLWCVQLYKDEGLIAYPKSNFDERKLKNEVDIEFIDFMDDTEKVPRNTRLEKMKLLQELRIVLTAANGGGKPLSANSFHRWVKKYCTSNELFFNPHIPQGKYDKSNSTEYYTIATSADFKPKIDNPLQPDLFEKEK